MRVLMLSWEYPPELVGGLGRHVHELSTALARAGHDVTVVSRHSGRTEVDDMVEGVRVIRVSADPPPFSPCTMPTWALAYNHAFTRAALASARSGDYDVVHAHDWLVAYAAVAVRDVLDIPLIATIHATEAGRHQGWLPDEASRQVHGIESWLVQEAGRIVVCSHYMAWEVNRLTGIGHRRLDIVPNGVERRNWRATRSSVAAARRRYAAGGGPLVGFAGRLVYEKGVHDLLHALPTLVAAHPELRAVIAGDGPYGPELRGLAEQLGVADRVTFTGFLGSQLPATLAACDLVVVPSLYEPFGMIALEAAAAGAPVVAAATGGLVEVVQDRQTGSTFPPGRPDALAAAAGHLLSDPAAARTMAGAAALRLDEAYTWPAIAAATADVYKRTRDEAAAFARARRARANARGNVPVAVPCAGPLL